MQVFKLLVLGIILAVIVGCSNPTATLTPDDDVISNNTYENKYFSFSLPIPYDWTIADSQAKEAMWQASKELVAKNNPTLEAGLNKARQTTYQMLTISQKPIGTLPNPGPSIIVGAEKVSQVPSIKNGRDYISQTTRVLIQQLPYEPLEKIYEYNLDGKLFYRADLTLNVLTGHLRQSCISMVSKEYALTFILTGQTEEEMDQLESIVNSGNFESVPTEVVKSESPASSVGGVIGIVLMIGGCLVYVIAGWSKRRKVKTDKDNIAGTRI